MRLGELWDRWAGYPFLVGMALLVVLTVAGTCAAFQGRALQKADPPVRMIKHAELYRSAGCVVTRVTVYEPAVWRQAVTEFFVVEGGLSPRNGRLGEPKCRVLR